jgi:DNA-binding response OmpR family regulator
MKKILIIEDEPEMLLGLQDNCEYEGYGVLVARNGEAGMDQAARNNPDLILLDVMLPDGSGYDVCRQLRHCGIETPVIMLTARGQEIDKVIGLEAGADDYVTKPFSLQELLARIRAHLRRASKLTSVVETFQFSDLKIDFRHYQSSRAGHPLDLSPREYELLKYLVTHEGTIVTRDELLNGVWGYNQYPVTRTVDNHIAKLRQKIEDSPSQPKHIITVHRVGYKFLS